MTIADELRALLGERFSTATALREQHSHGEDGHPPALPDGVAFATTTEEVAAVLRLCAAQSVPVTPFGAGTSLEGHVTPVQGGISLDLSRMTRILAIHEQDMDCRVEAGVTRAQLNDTLRDRGLFFPVDPGSHCTLGGMAATRASGTTTVRYGSMRDNVLGLTVVLADGRILRTGGRVRKSAAGYDLTRLFVGSEGTLGVITEIGLRLHPIPEAISAAVCQFATLAGAVETVMAVMAHAIPMARIEILDDAMMRDCIAYAKLESMTAAPTLFLEFHGSETGVAEQAAAVEAIAREHGGQGFAWARAVEERSKLWQARHDAFWAARASRPGYNAFSTDAVVPISKLAEAILGARQDIEESGLSAPIAGHVGDGNFHALVLIPPEPEGLERAWALDSKIVARALALGGSCSGEHGIGLGKRGFALEEHGETAMGVMRAIKATLDPAGILNPGKIFL